MECKKDKNKAFLYLLISLRQKRYFVANVLHTIEIGAKFRDVYSLKSPKKPMTEA